MQTFIIWVIGALPLVIMGSAAIKIQELHEQNEYLKKRLADYEAALDVEKSDFLAAARERDSKLLA